MKLPESTGMDPGRGTLVLKENSGWLRYVFWGAAIGMFFLAIGAFNAPVPDVQKAVLSLLGVALLGFSGFALPVRCTVIDSSQRKVTLTCKRFMSKTVERMRFDEIRSVAILTTLESVENLRGTEELRKRWGIAFVLEERSVSVKLNLYLTHDQAVRDAKRIQQLLGVELTDSTDASIDLLARGGRKIEAMALASRTIGKPTTEARNFVVEHVAPGRDR